MWTNPQFPVPGKLHFLCSEFFDNSLQTAIVLWQVHHKPDGNTGQIVKTIHGTNIPYTDISFSIYLCECLLVFVRVDAFVFVFLRLDGVESWKSNENTHHYFKYRIRQNNFSK